MSNHHCFDMRGAKCFACDSAGRCKCLKDTRFKTRECPFFKTTEQILEEDPDYYHNLMQYRGL